MNRNGALLAVLGLAGLTGCGPEVMDERQYKPLKDDQAVAESREADGFGDAQQTASVPAPAPLPAESARPAAPAQTAAPAGFAPMQDVKSSGGVTGKAPRRAGKRSGSAVSAKGGVYIVQPGDYPGKIARKHRVSLGALLEANKLTPESSRRLRIGQKLVIPGGKAAVSRKASSDSKAVSASAGKGFYIVQPGDYPERIARKNKVKLSALLKANGLTIESSRRLRIGQKLVIPGAGAGETAAAAPAEVKPAVTGDVQAESTSSEAQKPAEKSGVAEADALERELEKTAPAGEKTSSSAAAQVSSELLDITEDTTIQALAAKYNTTEENLRSLNEGFTGDTITKGSYFFVPVKK